jgi:hypothetical protein
MRDTITIGSIAGLISSGVIMIYSLILDLLGFKFIAIWESAASIILDAKLLHTPIGFLIGLVVHIGLGCACGVMLAYILRFTGKDFYLMKGVGLTAIIWLGSIGFFMRLLRINLNGRGEPFTNLLSIVHFIVFGGVCSTIIAKYAKFKVGK